MINYIFDVDGTLTPSRGIIDPTFKEFFIRFCNNNDVTLVTGSDRAKTIEQIGYDGYLACNRVYNCSGNDVYEGDENISFSEWYLPIEAEDFLLYKLASSRWLTRTGNHIEHRTGLVNFSVVGRNARPSQRKNYYEWDCIIEVRINIASEFNDKFPELEAAVGGETGIDIFERGKNKSQILKDFDTDTIQFYGDRTDENGNDYPIANELLPEQVYAVDDWRETWSLLR